MKKIIFIVYYLDTGGVSSSLSCLYNYLKKDNDIRVYALCHEGPNVSSFNKVVMPEFKLLGDYYRFSKPQTVFSSIRCYTIKVIKKICNCLGLNVLNLLMTIARKRILKTFQPDIVVAYQENDAAVFASTFGNIRKISWIHFDYTKHIPKNKNEYNLFSKFDKIVCVSKYTAKTFQNRYCQLANNVDYVYNLMDKNRILRLSQEKLEDNHFDTSLFTIISVGRISPEKGFSNIPAIAKYMKQEGCRFYWYVIGPANNQKEVNELKNQIQENEVSDCVVWLGERTNPYPYFKRANLYVSTSFTEACPMVFNEAHILGVPIVSTDFGSSFEFINEGVDGMITNRENLPATLVNVIKNDELYLKLVQGTKVFHLDDTPIHKQIDELLLLD